MVGWRGYHMIPPFCRYRSSVPSTVLLHFEGVGTAIVDSSSNSITVGTTGSVTQSTSQAKFGTKSLALTGGYITLGVSPPTGSPFLIPGTQNFTIDFWAYFTALPAESYMFDSRTGFGTTSGFGILQQSGKLGFFDGAVGTVTPTAVITPNAWHHIEVGRQGTTIYMFVDGVLVATGTYGNNWSSGFWIVGAVQFSPPGVEPMTGFIDEFHGLIGTCLHTANFTPPTAPYPPP